MTNFPTCGLLRNTPSYTTMEPPCYGRNMKFCGAYTIFHLASGKVYVGSTSDLYHRKQQHLSLLRGNTHPNARLQEAYNYDGRLVFEYSLTNFSVERALEIEQLIIDQYFDSGILFNYGRDAVCPTRGITKTDEQIEKIRNSKIGVKQNLTPEMLELRREIIGKVNEVQQRPVVVDGVRYPSIFNASKELDVPKTTVWNRLNNPNFDSWRFI